MEKQRLLKDALKGIRGVDFAYHAPYTSALEAVFARGDRRLAGVLESAYSLGARFDSWDEHFKREAYDSAFEENGLNPHCFANRRRDVNEPLPWDHIDMVVEKEYLIKEYEKAMRCAVTKDCRKGCNGCFGERYADYCKVQ